MPFDVDPQNPLNILGLEEVATLGGSPDASVFSTDAGSTWTSIPYASGMQDQFQTATNNWAVRFGAPGTNTAFACGKFGMARLSFVAGTWSLINNGMSSGAQCHDVAVDLKISGAVHASMDGGLYRSTDGGNSWSLLSSTATGAVTIDPTSSNNLYVSTGQRSTDGGKTWAAMPLNGLIAVSPIKSNIVYGVTSNSLCLSSDSGLTAGCVVLPVSNPRQLVIDANGDLLISTALSGIMMFTPQ